MVPSPEALPPTERRRAGKGVRLSLGAGLAAAADAGLEPRGLVATFASSTGDGENIHAICEALASDDRLISPTRFHNSVHNAPSGYWGIATGAMEAADSLAAFDASFGAGLLEAMCRVASASSPPVLLVAYDSPYPEPLLATRPLPDCFAVGLVITPEGMAPKGARIEIELTHAAPTLLAEKSLERIRRRSPRHAPRRCSRNWRAPGRMRRGRISDGPDCRGGDGVNAVLVAPDRRALAARARELLDAVPDGTTCRYGRWRPTTAKKPSDARQLPIVAGIEYGAQAAAAT